MVHNARTFFALLMVAGAATMFVGTNSYAAQDGTSNKEQDDGCDHGASGKECRDDPSEKGKDCEEHGKQGGVNEDHCTTTTTTEGDVTVTTLLEEVTTTTLPAGIIPGPPGPAGPAGPQGPAGPAGEDAPRTAPPADDLPATGASPEALATFAGGLLLFGTGLRRLTRQPA